MKELSVDNKKKLNDYLLAFEQKENELVNLIIENIPEWKRLINCKQHDIHDYNLDTHTLLVLKRVGESPDFSKLREETRLIVLYAALLHDIEKNKNEIDPQHPQKGAEKAALILYRLGFNRDFTDRVCTLIKYHQALGLMASGKKRFTPEELALALKDPVLVDLLEILSIADIRSVKEGEAFFVRGMDEKIREIVNTAKKFIGASGKST